MSNEIKVTQAGMSGLIDRLSDAIQGIEQILDRLNEDVAKLRGGWTGAASDSYDRAQKAWTAELGEMRELLAHHRSNTVAGAEIFRDAVQKNQDLWS